MQIRIDGVGAAVLLYVSLQLVDDADPTALMTGRIDEHSTAFGRDPSQRRPQLDSAVASQGAEGIAGKAFGVHAREHALPICDPPRHQREVNMAAGCLEGVGLELTERRRQGDARDFRDR